MKNAIEINELTKHYTDFTLNSISFNVQAGYITGFIGPNGSGKTTTLKAILGMIHSEGGSIKVLGDDNTLITNSEIGIVMDSSFFVEDWTAEDVGKVMQLFYLNWDSKQFSDYLMRFNIGATKKIRDLSRGMKVKVMLATALSHDAKLLLLDEPTSGLDPVAREEICELLSEFVGDESHSVFFSTHITSDLERIADYIVFILNGRILYQGTKDELLESYRLVRGGLNEIDQILQEHAIGLRRFPTGFEAMIPVTLLDSLSSDLLIESVDLDQIIVFMNKEERR